MTTALDHRPPGQVRLQTLVGIRWIAVARQLGALLFTEQHHPQQFHVERRRVMPVTRALDLALAVGLLAGASLVAAAHPVAAFFGIGLAAGMAVTSYLIEPATSTATFGQ